MRWPGCITPFAWPSAWNGPRAANPAICRSCPRPAVLSCVSGTRKTPPSGRRPANASPPATCGSRSPTCCWALLTLANWAQAIVLFNGDAATYLNDTPLIFRLHIFLGLTIILLFPFTRLVHVWSIPLGYLGRNYQIVRRR
ncbi:respiratory nitrate reductase subunit gamma [Pseudomonas sp. NPDC089752]|uniref:respiratory nitrate reductase subunit gamma n=1 Tax=Pseudomonas sp. NPDC089752 TaxID=3364472 RepID=UPI00380067D4